jgi:hypothetical protein
MPPEATSRLPATVPRNLVVDELAAMRGHGLAPVLFGGWAKELLAAWPPGQPHEDLDVLVVARDMAALDAFVAARAVVPFKRHAHKLGYLRAGRLVEMVLVTPTAQGLVTDFYGSYRRRWLAPLSCDAPFAGHTEAVATPANIAAYERDHPHIQDALYAAQPELRAEFDRRYGSARIPCRNPFPG